MFDAWKMFLLSNKAMSPFKRTMSDVFFQNVTAAWFWAEQKYLFHGISRVLSNKHGFVYIVLVCYSMFISIWTRFPF